MTAWLENKRVLVTGGAGAFGHNFLRAAKQAGAASVTILSRDEMKHAALRRELGDDAKSWARLMLGDINDADTLRQALVGVDCVIHAAAMKHLPECEHNVLASTRVNVIGTYNVVNAYLQSSATALIFLSTDKAPYASSVYGAQKYVGEKLVTEAARLGGSDKRAFTLRYSNVMDSTGSVFHIFKQLLSQGGTASVNGSQTSRGFVTQGQVMACIDRALSVARGGEVIALIPRVVRIAELAETMRDIIGTGAVKVNDSTMYLGEKESATLVMSEELAIARDVEGLDSKQAVLLDCLGRHSERPAARDIPNTGLTLADCARLAGDDLKKFLLGLL